MLGNNGGTLTGTFEGYVFEDVRDENSQSEDSVISIIIFYNIHGTATIHISICRYFYSLQKCNNTSV